ncbi:MAG: phosphoribosyl-AMP cyclohydrolase [Coriobacteriia bacterium]|nr:phosphoribosyl-AMP cyclohydrolase [Coriobacteriia bacterium]
MKSEDLKYNELGLIPAIVQQFDTREVLMMAWMNAESVELTKSTQTTWFWSRSRGELWNKGATSGNVQRVKAIYYDCDEDCLLIEVDSPGVACHTGERSCFYRQM